MSRVIFTSRHEKSHAGFSLKKYFISIGIGLLTVGIAGGAVYALVHPSLRVGEVSFSGLKVLSEETLREDIASYLSGFYLYIFPKNSIFLINTNSLTSMLISQNLRVKELSIEKKFPRSLAISVKERLVWGIACEYLPEDSQGIEKKNPLCVYLDEDGFALESSPQSTGGLIRKIRLEGIALNSGSQLISQDLVSKMKLLEQKFTDGTGSRIVEFIYSSVVPREISARVDEGYLLMFSLEEDFDTSIRVLMAVFREETGEKKSKLEHIDLRFGNKVFYKFK